MGQPPGIPDNITGTAVTERLAKPEPESHRTTDGLTIPVGRLRDT